MCRKIFQAVGTASAKALRWHHACLSRTSREVSATGVEAERRRAAGDEHREPEVSRSGEVWWVIAATSDLPQVRRDNNKGFRRSMT